VYNFKLLIVILVVFTKKVLTEHLIKLIAKRAIRVLVICSEKQTFLAGTDLDLLFPITREQEALEFSKSLHQLFAMIENLKIPSIAAMQGSCLGTGLELALSCSYRVAAKKQNLMLGIPEVKFGLIPSGGATVKLPMIVGLQEALKLLLPGANVGPFKARAIGLVDFLLEHEDRYDNENRFFQNVRKFAASCIETEQHVNRIIDVKLPFMDRFLSNNVVGRNIIENAAVMQLDKSTRGEYPAPYHTLASVMYACSQPVDKALEFEANSFALTCTSLESKHLISVFFMQQEAKRFNERFTAAPLAVKNVAIVTSAATSTLNASSNFTTNLHNNSTTIFTASIAHWILFKLNNSMVIYYEAQESELKHAVGTITSLFAWQRKKQQKKPKLSQRIKQKLLLNSKSSSSSSASSSSSSSTSSSSSGKRSGGATIRSNSTTASLPQSSTTTSSSGNNVDDDDADHYDGLIHSYLERLVPTSTYSEIGPQVQLVICCCMHEKFEQAVKMLRECESRISDTTIMAIHTNTYQINDLARHLKIPERVVGLHFSLPVWRIKIIEIVRGKETTEQTLATIYKWSLSLGKIPIIVNDGPGFVLNRILGVYAIEATRLLVEGAPVELIDRALSEFGMRMGPFRLLDEIGIDYAQQLSTALEPLGKQFSKEGVLHVLHKMHDNGYLGRRVNKGFYRYSKGRQISVEPTLGQVLPGYDLANDAAAKNSSSNNSSQANSEASNPWNMNFIVDRCILLMINEAARALEDHTAETPRDIDLAMLYGAGFSPFRGGLLSYADQLSLKYVVKRLGQLQHECKNAQRFKPAYLLTQMAQADEKFFPQRPYPQIAKDRLVGFAHHHNSNNNTNTVNNNIPASHAMWSKM